MLSRPTLRVILFLAVATLAACGGDDDGFIDAPRIDAPVDAADIDAPVDAPVVDAPDIDAPVDAPDIDAPDIDAPIDASTIDAAIDAATDGMTIDAPSIDAAIDAPPPIDAPSIDAAIDAPPPIDAPSIDAPIDAPPPIDAAIDAPAPLPGDLCSSAQPITLTNGMASIASTTLAYTNNYAPGVCDGVSSAGPDRVHSITIPAGQRLTASVVPTAGTFDPGIFVIGGPSAQCDMVPISCLAANDAGGDGATDAIVYNNTSTNAIDVFIMIDGFRVAGDAYTLNVNVGAIPPAPQGDVCGTAPTITLTNGMATVAGTTVNFNDNYDPGVSCTGYFTTGPDSIHQISVAAGGTLTVTLTPAAAYDAGIYLIQGPALQCDAEPIVCLDGADVGFAGDDEVVTYTNATAAPVTVFIGVDGDIDLSSGDTYSLQVSVALP